jgi:acylphosphatase
MVKKMAIKRAKIIVQGTVQGVFFRDYAKAEALKLELSGWVKNLKKGKSVEVVIEGEYEQVVQMIKWLKVGSPGSVVTGINIKEEQPTGETAAFNIRF